ncbi:MAG TPA: cupin domain-containing protein [Candidatus Angelobacter sp.]|nr:cupin domain-containing protein [Candidatus Angelobacter sp.]
MNRRSLLYAFGLASVVPLISWSADVTGNVVFSPPGDSRFPFTTAQQAKGTPCKLSSENTAGACTILELNALARSGPFLHVHHREDEWHYVLSGEFLFRAGGEERNLVPGASIWLPRGIPHVWANTTASEGKLILLCQPGGYERFFDEMGNVPTDKKSPEKMKELMAKYEMDLLGPPIFASSWMQQH